MNTPEIVSPEEWAAARRHLLVKEKALTRARDALAAERRRMPWLAVEKAYEFEGPEGKRSLLDLFEGRRQLIVYRAFFEPGVNGWPEHACIGCSMVADQVAPVAHLNTRDTTLAFVSRAPQADIERVKERMGWEMPWYTLTDDFDADFGVDEWHGTNAFIRDDDDNVFRTYFIDARGDEALGQHLELPRHDRARAPGDVGGLAGGVPADVAVRVVDLARRAEGDRPGSARPRRAPFVNRPHVCAACPRSSRAPVAARPGGRPSAARAGTRATPAGAPGSSRRRGSPRGRR